MKFIIFPGIDDVFYKMFDEVNDKSKFPKVEVRKKLYIALNKFFFKIRNKLSYHDFGGGIINSFVDYLTSHLLNIKISKTVQDEEVCYVFSNLTFRVIPNRLIRKISKNKRRHIAVYLLDSSSQILCKETINKCLKNKIKFVYTFDHEDAKKYGFHHFYYIYSKFDDNNENNKKEKLLDIVFFGSDKGRLDNLLEISNFFRNKSVRSKMSIIGVKRNINDDEHITINKPIPYNEMIEEIKKSKCILDYVIDEQSGLSYRPMEAICYNKKLLTNNKSIFSFPFYNPRYMQYFNDIEQINTDFLKEDLIIDYKYKGEYSPKAFLEKIYKDINMNKGEINNNE